MITNPSENQVTEALFQRLGKKRHGRDEMNLCELPFATLSERNSGRNTLHYELEEFDTRQKKHVRRTLSVYGDARYGLPTEKDEEIYLGLLKLTHDYHGFRDPVVHFSRGALFELMGWPKSDWAYKRLTTGMHRLVGVRLDYQNLWRDNQDKEWRDQGAFGILDSFEFRDARAAGSQASFTEQHSLFRWGSVLFKSFRSGYLKQIDYDLVRDLSPTARRLYRYLDKYFYPPHKTMITIDLKRLAYEHIGISRNTKLDKVRKRYIGPAAEELIRAGYLKPDEAELFQMLRVGNWTASFQLNQDSRIDPKPVEQGENKLVVALCRRGISQQLAQELTA
ncbi:MAG: replication initiator protein A, partial [Planctomycetaceae bacterium]|nr:replication initiator protein A [Planctomycetaceae bacterium]